MGVDTHTARFAPQVGHWDEFTGIMADGSLFAMFHLSGYAAELAGVSAVTRLKHIENNLSRNLSDPRIEIWDHFVRQDRQAMSPLPEVRNWFAERFDAAYRGAQGHDLFRNDLFLSVVLRREDSLRSGLQALAGGGVHDYPQADRAMETDLKDILNRMMPSLKRFGVKRLGLRPGGFSEIFEALHLIANGYFRPIGLTQGRLGRLIVPERVVFVDRKPGEFHILREGTPIVGGILAVKEYPSVGTKPTMFDELRHAPYSLTMTNAWLFKQKMSAMKFLRTKSRNMKASNDEGTDQTKELTDESKVIMAGKSVYGLHSFLLAIRASSVEQLDRNIAHGQNILSDASITVIRETEALKPAFYAQIVGNMRWHPRPAPIKSINWVSMAAKHNAPRGRHRGRWGPPVVMLRTTSNTEYAFHFQVQGSAQISKEDLGNCMFFGPAGVGKTSLLGTVCLLALRVPTARVVIMDKDFGLAPMAKAAGGSHLVLKNGKPGLAPLMALDDSPDDIAHLERLGLGMILSDGQGNLSNEDQDRLLRGIKRQMQMPREMRSWWGVAAMLSKRKDPGKESASDRLRPWCRGERLGWVVDGPSDHLDMSRRLTCIETGSFLKNEIARGPILAHLFYRSRKLINGQPLVLAVDEGWVLDTVPECRDEYKDNLKTIRKNEGVVVLATQSPGLALKSEIADDYKQQIPTKIFFADSEAKYEDLVTGMGLTDAEYDHVVNKLPNMPFTFLVKRPSGSVLCTLNLSDLPGMVSVISGRRSTYDLMERLIAKHGDDPSSWVPHFERQAPSIVDEPTLNFAEAAE